MVSTGQWDLISHEESFFFLFVFHGNDMSFVTEIWVMLGYLIRTSLNTMLLHGKKQHAILLGGSSQLLSRLVHPSQKWIISYPKKNRDMI